MNTAVKLLGDLVAVGTGKVLLTQVVRPIAAAGARRCRSVLHGRRAPQRKPQAGLHCLRCRCGRDGHSAALLGGCGGLGNRRRRLRRQVRLTRC